MQTERDVNGLIAALKHTDPLIRRRAAAALRVVGDPGAVSALKLILSDEQDAEARIAMVAALDYLTPQQRQPQQPPPDKRPQTRAERLLQHLTGPRPDLAKQAANALSELRDTSAVPALVTVFRNRRQPPDVRLAAAEALLAMNSAPAEVSLLAALRNDRWHFRRNAAAVLGQLKAEWAVGPLARALYDPNELVAKTARAALRRIGSTEARQALEDAKRAMIDTADAIDPNVISKAQRLANEQITSANLPVNSELLDKYLADRRKKGTAGLQPPKPKPVTGTLKKPVTDELPQPPPAPQPPAPPKPDESEPRRTQTQKLKRISKPKPPSSSSAASAPKAPESGSRLSEPPKKPAPAEDKPKPALPAEDTPAPSKTGPKRRVKSRRRKSATQRLRSADELFNNDDNNE